MFKNQNLHYWINKSERANIAQEHTIDMEKNYSDKIQICVRETKLYDSKSLFHLPSKIDMKIDILDLDSVSAIFSNSKGKTAVLNFASYKNPGGMFLKGSKAQEECLCHESFLYNVLKEQSTYYNWNNQHKNKALYLNRALYSPNILFMKNQTEMNCNVITCAAPNKTAAQKYCNISDTENKQILESRIDFVLKIAADNQVDTIILGAFGCGGFGQDAKDVAESFKKCLEKYHCFKYVIFAIPNSKDQNLKKFKEVFKL